MTWIVRYWIWIFSEVSRLYCKLGNFLSFLLSSVSFLLSNVIRMAQDFVNIVAAISVILSNFVMFELMTSGVLGHC